MIKAEHFERELNLIVDEDAASRLRHKDYYRYAYTHKPAWQGI